MTDEERGNAGENVEALALRRWARFARRQVRQYVVEVGDMPPLSMWVSQGASPRRARLVPAVAHDVLALKEVFRDAVVEHGSHLAAVGARLKNAEDVSQLGGHFGLVVIGPFERLTFGAPIERERGRLTIGGWQDGTFQLGDDFAFVQQALRASRRTEAREALDNCTVCGLPVPEGRRLCLGCFAASLED